MSNSSPVKNVIISKQTITRLVQDVKQMIKNANDLSNNGIYYVHDEEDMLKGYALIIGPEDTPYFGGFYFFEIHYPSDYPHTPPKVIFKTNGENIRFNPNLYVNGKVCISLLNTWKGEQWTSCQSISTILLTLCTLLCNDPLLNEPGIDKNCIDFTKYTRIIEYKNIDIAILNMIRKEHFSQIFDSPKEIFYSVMKEHFLKNSSKIMQHLQDKQENYPKVERLFTNIYKMDVSINYKALNEKFKHVLENLEKN